MSALVIAAFFAGAVVAAEVCNLPHFYGFAFAIAWQFTCGALLHEIGHVVVGRKVGLTLVGFGYDRGPYVQHHSNGPVAPRSWGLMAAAGPAVDIAIGFIAIGGWLALGRGFEPVSIFLLTVATFALLMALVNLDTATKGDGFIIKQCLASGATLPLPKLASPAELFTVGALSHTDKQAVLALVSDEVIQKHRLGTAFREQLEASYDADIAQLHLGVPRRLGLWDDSRTLVGYVFVEPVLHPTGISRQMVSLGLLNSVTVEPARETDMVLSTIEWLHEIARIPGVLAGAADDAEARTLEEMGLRFSFEGDLTFADGSVSSVRHFTSISPRDSPLLSSSSDPGTADLMSELSGDVGSSLSKPRL